MPSGMVPKKALHAGEHGYVRKNVNSATCCHASGNCLHAIAAQPHLAKTAHHISVLKPWKQSAVQCSQTSHSDSSTNKIQSVFLYDQHDSSDGNVIDPPVQEKIPCHPLQRLSHLLRQQCGSIEHNRRFPTINNSS